MVVNVPGLNEIMRGEQDGGILVPPGDTVALSDALRKLIRDPDLRTEFGNRARSRTMEFRLNSMIDGYVDLYYSAHERSAQIGGRLLMSQT